MNMQEEKYIPSLSVIQSGMLGEAVGDAVGVPVEFINRDKFWEKPVTGMIGNGTWNKPAGTWSDDSSMSLAAMASITDEKKVNWNSIMDYFVKWLDEDYFTTDGNRFDCGGTIRNALYKYTHGGNPLECGPKDEQSAGNGSLMRIYPFAMYYADGLLQSKKEEILEVANASKITHGAPLCQQACVFYASLLAYVACYKDQQETGQNVEDENNQKTAILANGFALGLKNLELAFGMVNENLAFLREDLSVIASYRESNIEELPSGGFVLDSLRASLWCFINTQSYEECVLKAVNLGKDTDTTAAIVGMLAGIYYGENGIPKQWLETIFRRGDICKTCSEFYLVLRGLADMEMISKDMLLLWKAPEERRISTRKWLF